MIEGLKLDVKADELVRLLNERIAHHQNRANTYEAQLRKLSAIQDDSDNDEEDVVAELRGRGSALHGVERKLRDHSDRAGVLTFVRDHIVRDEVYRLTEEDLRTIEVLPDRYGRW
jgi:hypothetical protein